jgi:hypothetical protein
MFENTKGTMDVPLDHKLVRRARELANRTEHLRFLANELVTELLGPTPESSSKAPLVATPGGSSGVYGEIAFSIGMAMEDIDRVMAMIVTLQEAGQ